MVATLKGPDIIRKLREAHPELDAGARLGVVSSFCKDSRVEANAGRKSVEIVGTLTTDDIDLDEERVLPDGIDFNGYMMKNRNWFVDHDYSLLSCVGKVRSLTRKGNGWQYRVQMLYNPENPLIQAVVSLAEAGSCPTSIGFCEKDGGAPTKDEERRYPGKAFIVRKCVAVEGSFTAMPCNVSCQSGQVVFTGSEEKAETARGILVKSRIPEAYWARLGLAPVKAKRRILVWDGR